MIEGISDDVDLVWSSLDGPEWFNQLSELTAKLGGCHKWSMVYERTKHRDNYWVEQAGDYYKVMENDGLERSIKLYETSLL